MLKMSNSVYNQPVMSLRNGGQIGVALEPVINPHNFKILGWWCRVKGGNHQYVLLAEDVREVMPEGLAVNDEADLSLPADLHRHREILDIRWQLPGKVVRTKNEKLGKVREFSYDETSFFIQKLYVERPLVKVFLNDNTLVIDRSQVLEVTDSYIMVEEPAVTETAEEAVPAAEPAAT